MEEKKKDVRLSGQTVFFYTQSGWLNLPERNKKTRGAFNEMSINPI